jgi:CIC family chloride channel protein
MNHEQELPLAPPSKTGSLVMLAFVSFVVGVASGLVGTAFRLSLEQADRWRNLLIAWAWEIPFGIGLVIVACALGAALAAWLVRRFSPYASGSGIPHVEAVIHKELPPAPFWLLPVKFVGGLLAIGAGLALGREGPSVQMGSSVAHLLGVIFRRNLPDCLVLMAAGAGAGLATAFNAPIAGAIFVLEELFRRFDTRVAIATFGASTGAISVARFFLGNDPDFHVESFPYPSLGTVPVHLVLGIIAGFLGVVYNYMVLDALGTADRFRSWPVELRAALIGAMVGFLAWFMPDLVGGGNPLTQRTLTATDTVMILSLAFVARFELGALSYATLTPGGLFAPLLVLGAQSGLLFGIFCAFCFPSVVPDPKPLAVVGMAAFFTAVVRAPLTGLVLVIEMTGSFTTFLPMLGACFSAMLVPTLLGSPPIYDSLRERTLRTQKKEGVAAARDT